MIEVAKKLAEVRGQTVEAILSRFSEAELQQCPRRFSKALQELQQAPLASTGIRDGMAYAELSNSKVFFSYISYPSHRREYRFVHDILPACVTEDTYLAALDVAQRYLRPFAWKPGELLKKEDNNIIEIGAYLGHKTIHLAEELAGRGRVLAIEMMPGNVEILCRNIGENGMGEVIDIASVGVAESDGVQKVYGKGRQRHSLIPIERLNVEVGEVPVKSLDAIVAEWGRHVDLVYMSVNGGEVEALRGLGSQRAKIDHILVETPYQRDGRPSADICRDLLLERGYALADFSVHLRVIGVPPR